MKQNIFTEEQRRQLQQSISVRELPFCVDVTRHKEKRSVEQNSKLHPMLRDISKQVEWYGRYLSEADWKNIFTAALRGYESVPGIDGRSFVVLGRETRSMTKNEMSNLIELVYAFGSERRVVWSEPADKNLCEFYNMA